MKNKNICKFVSDISSDKLDIINFIYEADIEIINSKCKLSGNRIILIKSGDGVLSFDNRKFHCHTGTLIFGFSGEEMSGSFGEGAEYMFISFDGARAQSLFRRFGITRDTRCFENYDSLIPLWYDSLSRADENSIELSAESIVLYSFSRFSGITEQKNILLSEIIKYTEENFSDFDLSLKTISKEFNYNPKYISYFFKDRMKIGYSEYLRNFRIKYAILLFDHGLDSIKNVAFMCGFSDPLYFSTSFKSVMGMPPREYIKKAQARENPDNQNF